MTNQQQDKEEETGIDNSTVSFKNLKSMFGSTLNSQQGQGIKTFGFRGRGGNRGIGLGRGRGRGRGTTTGTNTGRGTTVNRGTTTPWGRGRGRGSGGTTTQRFGRGRGRGTTTGINRGRGTTVNRGRKPSWGRGRGRGRGTTTGTNTGRGTTVNRGRKPSWGRGRGVNNVITNQTSNQPKSPQNKPWEKKTTTTTTTQPKRPQNKPWEKKTTTSQNQTSNQPKSPQNKPYEKKTTTTTTTTQPKRPQNKPWEKKTTTTTNQNQTSNQPKRPQNKPWEKKTTTATTTTTTQPKISQNKLWGNIINSNTNTSNNIKPDLSQQTTTSTQPKNPIKQDEMSNELPPKLPSRQLINNVNKIESTQTTQQTETISELPPKLPSQKPNNNVEETQKETDQFSKLAEDFENTILLLDDLNQTFDKFVEELNNNNTENLKKNVLEIDEIVDFINEIIAKCDKMLEELFTRLFSPVQVDPSEYEDLQLTLFFVDVQEECQFIAEMVNGFTGNEVDEDLDNVMLLVDSVSGNISKFVNKICMSMQIIETLGNVKPVNELKSDEIDKELLEWKKERDEIMKVKIDKEQEIREEQEKIRLEQERIRMQREKEEQERIRLQQERERQERIRLQKEREEQERIRLQKQREEQERIRLQKQREEQERIRLQKERQEQERIRLQKQREEQERIRLQKQREEQERTRLQKEKEEQERIRLQKEKEEQERIRLQQQQQQEEQERIRLQKQREEQERIRLQKQREEQEKIRLQKLKEEEDRKKQLQQQQQQSTTRLRNKKRGKRKMRKELPQPPSTKPLIKEENNIQTNQNDKTTNKQLMKKKTFSNWMNYYLQATGYEGKFIENLEIDISDGLALITLFQLFTEIQIENIVQKPTNDGHKLTNIKLLLQNIQSLEIDVSIFDPQLIVSGDSDQCLKLVWVIIDVLANGESSKEHVIQWVNESIQTVEPSWEIKNLSSDLESGLIFNALLYSYDPTFMPNPNTLDLKKKKENLYFAFESGENAFGIPSILDPEDFLIPNSEIDENSSLCWLYLAEIALNQ
ncbi:hypothetical protein M0812_02086 [Anaeramoeba flamelloides]|uniref:Calponin-homology (CH) domain-containing protein n=1 Tax=Anaeramoeba flamelloides TaxID=1746091 RepID=A0AAV7Z1U1_9EUKA|nr:hypothetical protein M0812_02086 [Anaeramoeba flamelloides]